MPAVAFAAVVIVGVVPASVTVPPETVPVLLNVSALTHTVPLTVGVTPAVFKTAELVSPLVESQGVPVTLSQFVADVSQVAPADPFQVPV
jgi:hypothetical protein